MSELYLSSPGLGDDDRYLFEREHAKGNSAVTSILQIDTTLRRIRDFGEETDIDLDELTVVAEEHLQTALQHSAESYENNYADYFRLKTKIAFIRPIVFANEAFSTKQNFELRRELMNGLYGTTAEILHSAIDALDHTDRNNLKDRSTLTGIINELTALALLNRRQSPERMAIPSDITADLYRATDLNYSLFKKGDEQASFYHIQVKSSVSEGQEVRVPAGGILISARNFLNTRSVSGISFPTSRAIIAEVDATSDNEQDYQLSNAVATLDNHITTEMLQSDKFFDAYNRLPKDLRDDVENVFRNVITRAISNSTETTFINLEIPEDN
jgi:hypothetical protein